MPVQAIPHAQVRPGSVPARPSGEPLRFGYTADDVDRLVRRALRVNTSSSALDADDRFESAWFAVVEQLYSAREAPGEQELVHAGLKALHALWAESNHARGYSPKLGKTAPGYARYWLSRPAGPEPVFVATVVDRLALRQIFTRITCKQRQALLALAMHQDHTKAAAALGLPSNTFSNRICEARATLLALWHEHETPPPWRRDHRTGRAGLPPRVAAMLTEAEIPAVILPDAREIFAALGADRLHSRDLLAFLQQDRPAVYGTWDQADLAAALRVCGIPPARDLTIGGVQAKGYQLETIEIASGTAATGGPVPDETDIILAAWLYQEQQADPAAALPARADMLDLITAAGPDGITIGQLRKHLDAGRSTIDAWLSREITAGTIARTAPGTYTAGSHAQTALPPRAHRGGPGARAEMLTIIGQAGPAGTSQRAIIHQLTGRAGESTVTKWLRKERQRGTIARLRQGIYAAREAVA